MLNFSGIDSSSFLGKALRKVINTVFTKGTRVPILQGPCRGMKWVVGSSIHGCWLGSYEMEKQKRILEYLKPGMIVYDIGANVGYYTLLFSRVIGNSGAVYAFEPFFENIYFLNKHLELNKLKNVIIVPVAISDKNGEIEFYLSNSSLEGTLLKNNISYMDSIQVLSLSLDTYIALQTNCLPDLIKMDVEGAEYLVLVGMQKLMQLKKPILFIAFHGEEIARKCASILRQFNYRTINLEGNEIDINRTYSDEIIAL
jgi:FkbM family methyltransferase